MVANVAQQIVAGRLSPKGGPRISKKGRPLLPFGSPYGTKASAEFLQLLPGKLNSEVFKILEKLPFFAKI